MFKRGKRSTNNEMVIDNIIGKNLLQVRKMRGMSQEEVSRRLGISFQQFQKYENGTNRLSCSRLYSICNVLGCVHEDILPDMTNYKSLEKTKMLRLYNLFIKKGVDIDKLIESFGE